MADGTLKSFLVDIGFRVDNPSLTKLHASLKQAGDAANQFGAYIIKQTAALAHATTAQQANTTATTAGTQATVQATTVGQQQLAMLNQINTAIQGLTTQMQHNQQTQQRMQHSARLTGAAWSLLKTAAVGMSTAFVGMGWAIERSLVRVNDNFENLFFMAQRTGVAVGRLQDVIFANKQIGISADQSRASLERLAVALRDNPGRKEWIEQSLLHGQTTKDPADMIAKMVIEYRKVLNLPAGTNKANLEYALRAQAGAVGFDPEQLRQQALNPTSAADEAWHKNMRERMGLGDADAIAEQARTFKEEWGKATASTQSAWERLTVAVTPFATTVANVISDALVEIAPDIDDLGKRLRVALEEFAGKDGKNLKEGLQPWIDDFKEWVKSLDEDKLRQFGRDLRLLLDIFWGIGKAVVATANAFEWLSSHIGGTMAALTFFFGFFLAKAALATAAAWGIEVAFKAVATAATGMWKGVVPAVPPATPGGAAVPSGAPQLPGAPPKAGFWGPGGFLAALGKFGNFFGIGSFIADEITSNPKKYPHLQPGYLPESVRKKVGDPPGEFTAPIPPMPEGTSHYLGAEDAGSEGGGPSGGADYGGAAEQFTRGETATSLLRDLLDRLGNWWSGSAGYSPLVTLAQEYYDKLHEMLRELLGEFGFQSVGGAAGGGGGGGGGGSEGGPGGPGEKVGEGKLSLGQMKKLAMEAGFSEKDASMMAAIAMAESGGDPYSVNKTSGAAGLTQILPAAHGQEAADRAKGDPRYAMAKAFELYKGRLARGENPFADWSAYKSGAYQQYLSGAQSARPEDMASSGSSQGMDPMAPAGSPVGGNEMTSIVTPSGKRVQVAKQFAANFLGFLTDYEKAGGRIGGVGGAAARPGNASYHPLGRAIDVNQSGYGIRSHQGELPEEVENQIAKKWGLFPGSLFQGRSDRGHFEVRNAREALAAIQRMRGLGSQDTKTRLGTEPIPGRGGHLGGSGAGATPGRQSSNGGGDSKYQVTINVHGVSDQAGTAEATLAAIRRHEQQFLRNNRTAVV